MSTFRDPETENFTRGTMQSVIGIINAPPIKIPYPRFFKCIQRIPIITPNFTQCIIEVESETLGTELVFYKNWRDLQFVAFQGIIYRGVTKQIIANKNVHIFRLIQNKNPFSYVWLSAENIWINPIKIPDPDQLPEFTLARCGKGEGILNMSPGSKFGLYWINSPFKNLHSVVDLHPYNFSDMEKFYDCYNRCLKNIPSGKLRNFLPDQHLLFHK